jgi:type I restriction enzyme, S subunit
MSRKSTVSTAKVGSKHALVPKFPEFREAWEAKALSSLGYFTGGGTPSKANSAYWAGEIPWISSSDLNEDSISQIRITRFITKEAIQESATKLVPKDSILLISRVGVGKLAVSTFPLCTSQDFTNFTPTDVDPWFLAYLLRSRKETLITFNQGTSIKGFTKDNIASLCLGFPSQAEQQKIAGCLSSVDDLIAAQAQKVDALKTHKKGLMLRLFPSEGETQPRLRFPKFQTAGDWEPKRLAGLVDIQSGATPSKATPEFWRGSIPWVSAKDMKRLFLEDAEDHISDEAVNEGARVVPPGTLLVLTRGMTLLKDVPICVLRREMSFNQDVKGLRPKRGVDGLFLAFMLTSIKDRLLAIVNVAGHGTGKIDTDELKALELVFPTPDEQQRIASCLNSLDALITAEIQKHEALKTHKKGLMQQLFPSPDRE